MRSSFCQRSLQMRAHAAGTHPWFRCQIVKFLCAPVIHLREKDVVIHLRSSHIKSALRASSQNSKRQCGCNRRQELISSPHDFSGERYDLVMVVITVNEAEACRRFPSGRGTILLWNLISFPGLVQNLWDRPRLSSPGNQASNQASD